MPFDNWLSFHVLPPSEVLKMEGTFHFTAKPLLTLVKKTVPIIKPSNDVVVSIVHVAPPLYVHPIIDAELNELASTGPAK